MGMPAMQSDGLVRGSINASSKRLPVDPGMNASVRSTVFAHLTGIVLAPTVSALWDLKILQLLRSTPDGVDLDKITRLSGANRAYLQVALRLLLSAGWLTQTRKGFSLTDFGAFATSEFISLYRTAASFAPIALEMDDLLFNEADERKTTAFRRIVDLVKERWGTDRPAESFAAAVASQLDGIIVGPAMVSLSRRGVFSKLTNGRVQLTDIRGNAEELSRVFELLAVLGWAQIDRGSVNLTLLGTYAARIATSYGVTVSYLARLCNLSALFGENPRHARTDSKGFEMFVDREMNVWGSGGAHKTYFKHVDEIVIDVFNRPLAEQPLGICDMGCGDGAFLIHLYSTVKERTLRGRELEKFPLVLVGADYNDVARRVSEQTLAEAKIPVSHVLFGDINRPAQLAQDLKRVGFDIQDFFHVRSFLDHNRPYLKPAKYVSGQRMARTSGAFVRLGEEIAPDALEENLVRHLHKWARYTRRFGLLILELHTLPPEITAANLKQTPAVAYDATHGYSDQYLVELPVFLNCALEAGLSPDPRFQDSFPRSELATVSLNLFTSGSRQSDMK